jgi:hypothetical protein
VENQAGNVETRPTVVLVSAVLIPFPVAAVE